MKSRTDLHVKSETTKFKDKRYHYHHQRSHDDDDDDDYDLQSTRAERDSRGIHMSSAPSANYEASRRACTELLPPPPNTTPQVVKQTPNGGSGPFCLGRKRASGTIKPLADLESISFTKRPRCSHRSPHTVTSSRAETTIMSVLDSRSVFVL
ncbi:hypothetical protein SERLA73DRAFT_174845 [Serpula lacrymans var. lacrymans S7.3]|uniref:Uncharacterized protein n=2 Tax=Serpula lacrymans var. lacrymans TaxID=341189 RepID=F8PIK7_SERL3|nr:uncharacterized protein SERLADRAFT_456524 [Serpula lacrymans var. lacrymans S7.9]EGO03378.1 hypothetical protein SERLA73DRAFT_174845 [Serpula lacrymans var. lacrymans S7.3]EGO29149.1 hypothetical protein SERLADRAFT_456524 [Serpula lacrymans var. lacrymans S7.9]